MSGPTKMLRTDAVEVVVLLKRPTYYVGPKARLRDLLSLLGKNEFRPVQPNASGSVPWETLAAGRIEKFTKPGLALRGARLKEGFTQAELGRKLGVSQYNISKMEQGNRSIGKKMAVRIGKVLRMNYRVFL